MYTPTFQKCTTPFRFLVLLVLLSLSALAAFADEQPETTHFTIDDYFELKRFSQLALSSDGGWITYVVESQSLTENKNLRHVYISPTKPDAEPFLIDEIQDGREFAWIPGTHKLAFLSARDGVTQIYSYDSSTKTLQQHTDGEHPVTRFRFASDGVSLAYLTQEIPDMGPSLFDQMQNGDRGILINADTASLYDFINPNWTSWSDQASQRLNALWIVSAGPAASEAKVRGDIKDFHWSTDTEKLSVTYIADDVPTEIASDLRTSLGIYDVRDKKFRVFGTALPPSDGQSGTYYTDGKWVPDQNKIFVQRINEKDMWTRNGEWSLVDASDYQNKNLSEQTWQPIETSSQNTFIPLDGSRIYVAGMVNAVRSLYQMTVSRFAKSNIVKDVKGSTSFFQFNDDFQATVYVNESLTHPPEIHIWRKGRGSYQLTHFNEAIAEKTVPVAKEVIWKSKDGTDVHGWLMEPVGATHFDKPWPMITYINGGPGVTMPDEFAFFFNYWPYPFEAYATNGMAVFIVNYRGMMSFGTKYANPAKIDGEPVDDILTGIDYLVEKGIADPDRLAISGQSHGAWLAPLAMTRNGSFRAASFAEGVGNFVTIHNLMSGEVNREVHDIYFGPGLYEDASRYLELSPELYFKGLNTAVLFEAGVQSAAVSMLGYSKAAQNAGMPTEYIAYPKTGHGITIPRLRRESAMRNLDWFRFWLKDEEDPDPAKAKQYARWRAMRN